MNLPVKLALSAILITLPNAVAADGTITFLYFANGTATDYPIIRQGTGPVDSSFTVGLYAGNQVYNDNAVPLATTPIFQRTGLFQYGGGDVAIPGSIPGQSVILTLKVWDGPSFHLPLTARGEVSFTTLPLGGLDPNRNPPGPGFPPPDLSAPSLSVGFHGLYLLPEPSVNTLAILGLAALAISGRRNPKKIIYECSP